MTTEERCATASCNGTVKARSLVDRLKRCGLCDKRKPFRKIVKCSECEIVYHRRCGRKLVARERDGTRTVGVDDDARDVHSTAGQAVIDGLDDPGYAEATTTTTAPTKAFRRRIRVLVDDADVRFTYHAEDGHRVTNVPHTYVSGADPKNVPLEISNRLS